MKIILGSKSPRRSQLLKELALDFDIIAPNIDESYPATLAINEVPSFIAKNKALAIKELVSFDTIILTADTLVTLDGVIYGKPKNKEEAYKMLSTLSARTHEVITGICLIQGDQIIINHEVTEVTFRQLTSTEINFYIDNYEPFDKAGSYGIQEWIGAAAITTINGSYNNVVGLPTHLVMDSLNMINR